MAGIMDAADGVLFGGANKNKAQDKLEEARRLYGDLPLPELERLLLQGDTYVGDVTAPVIDAPERLQAHTVEAATQGNTEMSNISVDPRLKAAQLNALSQMQEIGSNGGMNLADKANLSRIQSETSQADRGRRDAVLQNMNARGMGGSGAELMAQLQSSQAATDRSSQAGLDVAAQAQSRALQAMMQSGQMGGEMRGQEFGEQAKIASAQDAINNFNTGTTNNTRQFNAGQQTGADKFNIGNAYDATKTNAATGFNAALSNRDVRQNVSNSGTSAANASQQYNVTALPQKNFDNAKSKVDGQVDIISKQADLLQKEFDTEETKRGVVKGAIIGAGTKAATGGMG